MIAGIAAWFAILFTGRYPIGLFNYEEGVLQWRLRVGPSAFPLTTDRYPPFTLIESGGRNVEPRSHKP